MLFSATLAMLLFTGLGVDQPPSPDQDLQRKLQTRIEEYKVSEETFIQALAKVAAEFELPMGIEWVRTPRALRRVELSWRDTSPYGILQSLVKAQPGYELQIKNGVVHVLPAGFLTDRRSFLNLPIDVFAVDHDFVAFASWKLQQRLRLIVSPPPPPPPGAGWAGSMSTGLGDQRVSFSLEGVLVRDVLDKLALSASFKVWMVTYPETQELTRTDFLTTVSLYNLNITEEQQPVWELELWGRDPISHNMRSDWKFRPPTTKLE